MAEDIMGSGWCWGCQVSEVCHIILDACQENNTFLVIDTHATRCKWVFLTQMLGKTWLEKTSKRKLLDILTCWKGQQVKRKSAGQTRPKKDPVLTKRSPSAILMFGDPWCAILIWNWKSVYAFVFQPIPCLHYVFIVFIIWPLCCGTSQ